MNRFLKGAFFLSFAAATLTPVVAHADVIGPDEASCTGKSPGDSCTLDSVAGHCTTKKCNKLDYSDGSPPGTKEVDCLVCVTTGLDASTPSDGGGNADASDSTPKADGGSADGGGSATNSNNGGGSSGGCSLASVPGARAVGPWLLALLPLIVLRKRNRKQT